MLKYLKISGVGPVPLLEGNWGSRLNVITGDNGLGKSFLLDAIFWMLTETWPGARKALPELDPLSKTPTIDWDIAGRTDFARKGISSHFDFNSQLWIKTTGRHSPKSLVIYAGAESSFSVWDPARNLPPDGAGAKEGGYTQPPSYQFDFQSLANGMKDENAYICNGLIHDWVNWYYQGAKEGGSLHLKHLEEIIALFSPPEMPLKCGAPRNVFAGDTREFPTLQINGHEVPCPHWPAGVRRLVGLAYVLVWAWHEHLRAVRQRKDRPVSHIILLLDDPESNLSPAWQRTIFTALSRMTGCLDARLRSQSFVATRSPLTLASLEPHFDDACDRFFWFSRKGNAVRFQELPWVIHGDVNTWLMSIIFNLKQPRSVEAETAILAAVNYLNKDTEALPEGLKTDSEIGVALDRYLPNGDEFLAYWSEQAAALAPAKEETVKEVTV